MNSRSAWIILLTAVWQVGGLAETASGLDPPPVVLTLGSRTAMTAGPLAAGDFNRDGKPDVMAAEGENNRVSVFLGDGRGGFSGGPIVSATGERPRALVVADFNGDGYLDAATANETGAFFTTPGTVTVLHGNGSGALVQHQTCTVGKRPLGLLAADFDENGIPDLATADWVGHTVSVLLGTAQGLYRPAVPYAAGSNPVSLCAGDFDADGHIDLAVAASGDGTARILKGDGSGHFADGGEYAVGPYPMAAAAGDVDGDGRPDLVFANDGTDHLTLIRGRQDGTFADAETMAVGQFPRKVLAADLNRDGRLDLCAVRETNGPWGQNTLMLLLGLGGGAFAAPQSVYTTANFAIYPLFAALGDFNRDGKPDLVISDSFQDAGSVPKATVLLNNYLPGDANADDRVDLVDAVSLLKVGAGMRLNSPVYPGVDLNRDGRAGLEESIFVLQSLAGR